MPSPVLVGCRTCADHRRAYVLQRLQIGSVYSKLWVRRPRPGAWRRGLAWLARGLRACR